MITLVFLALKACQKRFASALDTMQIFVCEEVVCFSWANVVSVIISDIETLICQA